MSDTDNDAKREQIPNFEALGLALQSRPLQLESGNVVIKLDSRPDDTLLLHGSVLAAASERFAARLNSSHWEPTREVKYFDADAGDEESTESKHDKIKTVRVFEYHLAIVEDTLCLTDEKEASGKAISVQGEEELVDPDWGVRIRAQPKYRSFSCSSLVEGYRSCPYGFFLQDESIQAQSIYEHKVLFSMLYGEQLDIDLGTVSEAIATLTDLTALSEYYLLLPSLAHQISVRFEALPGFWKIVSQHPEFYLTLGMKLRSYTMFNDAMRHLVGRNQESSKAASMFCCGPPDESVESMAKHCLNDTSELADGLTKQLRSIGLSRYQAHPEAETRRKRGPEVRTTWLAAGLWKKVLDEKCRWIAASIYREKLDQLMYGEEHWSHVQYLRNGKKNGEVQAGSLFIACKALMAAHTSPKTLDIFGHNAANKFASMFNLRRTPQEIPAGIIAGELRRLVRSAVHAIQYWLPLPGAEPNQYARATPAMVQDVDYFTCVPINGYLWWEEEQKAPDWGRFEGGVEAVAASKKWLELMGV